VKFAITESIITLFGIVVVIAVEGNCEVEPFVTIAPIGLI
jgi:hypothetical protein